MLFSKSKTTLINHLIMALSCSIMLNACVTTAPLKEAGAPVSPQAQADYERAVLAMKSGKTKQAFNLFDSISKKHPELSGPLLNIGLLYLQSNYLKLAEKSFKQAIQTNPDNALGYNFLGVVYRRSGKFIEARQAYEQAISRNAQYANAHLNLGILYDLYMNDINRALHHYEQYQTLNGSTDKQVANWILDLQRRAKVKHTGFNTLHGDANG